MDVSGAAPVFSVTGIISPMGILRDTVPIPGDVVDAMASSITQLRTQFPPKILIGPPTSLTFQVTEGRGFSPPETVVLTNNGVFGSLLSSTLVSSAPYIRVAPAQLGNLASNEEGAFEVAVDSTGLLAANSPYSGTVSIQDSTATNTPQSLPITIEVVPKATIAVTPTSLFFTVVKPLTGAFPVIPSQAFTIENSGPSDSVLEWQLQRIACVPWLASFGPVSGTLNAGETEVITVMVAPPVSTPTGTYTETLRFSGFSTNQTFDVTLQLSVT